MKAIILLTATSLSAVIAQPHKCSLPSRGDRNDPSCNTLVTFSETDVGNGDSFKYNNDAFYKCCLGQDDQTNCAAEDGGLIYEDVDGNECKDLLAAKADCDEDDESPGTHEQFSPGYDFSGECTGLTYDCISKVTCDSDGGFYGSPSISCADDDGTFLLSGCTRGDAGTLGTDKTSDVFHHIPNMAPVTDNGNAKKDFNSCANQAGHFGAPVFVSGNGVCGNTGTVDACSNPHNCEVFPNFDGSLEPSSEEDTYASLMQVRSGSQDYVADDKEVRFPLLDSTAFSGFDFYAPRFSCWTPLDSSWNGKVSDFETSLDLTPAVIGVSVNEGIGTPIHQYETAQGVDWESISADKQFDKISDSSNDNGFIVCDKTDNGVGCTPELAASMCEAYNRVNGGLDAENACAGFVYHDTALGKKYKPGDEDYHLSDDQRFIVAFYSFSGGRLEKASKFKENTKAGAGFYMFEYSGDQADFTAEVLEDAVKCRTPSLSNCAKCDVCLDDYVNDNGDCVDDCPDFKYDNNGKCDSCGDFCKTCSTDSPGTCEDCIDNWINQDGVCYQEACTLPEDLEDTFTGVDMGGGETCQNEGNLEPSASCKVVCADGSYSSDPDKTGDVFTCGAEPGDDGSWPFDAQPDIVCTACSESADENCKTCPGGDCTACFDGYKFKASDESCEVVACPNEDLDEDAHPECTFCGGSTYGSVSWDSASSSWDSSACTECSSAVTNCATCKEEGGSVECLSCVTGFSLTEEAKCIETEQCPYGQTGDVVYDTNAGAFDTSDCQDTEDACHDENESPPKCFDCADGYKGSVTWDFTNQEWDKSQCTVIECPYTLDVAPQCTNCTAYQSGNPSWDDLTNSWVGCINNDFGFNMQASSDTHSINVKSAEMLHIINGQYDANKGVWVCDEGYAGIDCQMRICPETLAFFSGTDGFSPSHSNGWAWNTDIGTSTTATFDNQHSYRECGGRGKCNFNTGECQCYPGFTGKGCRRTACPNRCSGHGVCINDDTALYHTHSPVREGTQLNVPLIKVGDVEHSIEGQGNLWAHNKFQSCRCDSGWGGEDCSLRMCPHGDDPETVCDEDLGNDVQKITLATVPVDTEIYFALRFTSLIGSRYSTRALVIPSYDSFANDDDTDAVQLEKFEKATAHSIQTGLESLPNFAIPSVEVTASATEDSDTHDIEYSIEFVDARNSGEQHLLEILPLTTSCDSNSGFQPLYVNTDQDFEASIARQEVTEGVLYREGIECSGRGLCNRKKGECKCFDGYTGISCDVIAQTY